MLKKPILFLMLLFTVFSLENVKTAAGQEKFKFGVSNNLILGYSRHSSSQSMGLFFNYSMSGKLSMQMEVERDAFLPGVLVNQTSESSFIDGGIRREWSMSLGLNYQMKPVFDNFSPFVSFGAGKYYIQGSKVKIKQGKADPEERGLDYDMRRQFRRGGFFGALGLKFQPNSRTTLFMQAKCSVLFDRNDLMLGQPCGFTDLLNVTTGLRFNLN